MHKHPHVIPHPTTTPTFLSAMTSFIDCCIEQFIAVHLKREAFAAVFSKRNEVIVIKLNEVVLRLHFIR